MTIKPGEPWGSAVPLPAEYIEVRDDAEVARRLRAAEDDRSAPAVVIRGGDLGRTLGATGGDRPTVNELPLDLFEIRLDDADVYLGCAHLVAHRPWWRGGWWRGPVLLVMNAEFIGAWDVAPRGHPNDGRVDVFEAAPDMSIRQRLAARRRLRSATHVPHPSIVKRSVRTATYDYPEALTIRIDGRNIGRAATIQVTVRPDAAVVYS